MPRPQPKAKPDFDPRPLLPPPPGVPGEAPLVSGYTYHEGTGWKPAYDLAGGPTAVSGFRTTPSWVLPCGEGYGVEVYEREASQEHLVVVRHKGGEVRVMAKTFGSLVRLLGDIRPLMAWAGGELSAG